MKDKIFQKSLQILFFLLFFLLAGMGICPNLLAQQQANPATRVQPQNLRQFTVPPELLRQTLATVPRLEGREFDQQIIAQILERSGIALGNILPVVNNERIGIIISQTPAAGQRVQRGTPVNVTYGIQGELVTPGQPENVSVPDYVGLTLQRATGRMPNDRLQPGNIKEAPSDAEVGIVVDQFPEEGMIVDPGTRIDLTVSSGVLEQQQIPVPNLRGLTLQQAAEVLLNAKLFAGQLREEVSDENAGTVMRQSPPAGAMVPLESVVDITYSVQAPEELIIVPDVTNLPTERAILVLKDNQLNFLLKYKNLPGEPKDVVVAQEPLPGTRVPPGTDVQLTLPATETFPPWIFWSGGVLVAALLGGFIGRKFGRRRNKTLTEKDINFQLKPVLDAGKQSIESNKEMLILQHIKIKLIPDKGTQTIKTN